MPIRTPIPIPIHTSTDTNTDIDTNAQGGIKFEISWEPNFPVNNFARNNGKNCVIFLAVHRKIILFTENMKQAQLRLCKLGPGMVF